MSLESALFIKRACRCGFSQGPWRVMGGVRHTIINVYSIVNRSTRPAETCLLYGKLFTIWSTTGTSRQERRLLTRTSTGWGECSPSLHTRGRGGCSAPAHTRRPGRPGGGGGPDRWCPGGGSAGVRYCCTLVGVYAERTPVHLFEPRAGTCPYAGAATGRRRVCCPRGDGRRGRGGDAGLW